MAILYTAARDANENRYEGYVLEKIVDRSYRIMSDVWGTADFALVWDEKSNEPKQICVNVYDMNPESWRPVEIVVDATDEVRAKYLNWLEEREFNSLLYKEQERVRQVEKGCIAKVVKGRNGRGTVGKVVVSMDASYGMGYRARQMKKYAIATSDVQIDKPLRNGKVMKVYRDVVWAWACNVERVDIAKIDQDALRVEAKERALWKIKQA